MDKKIVIHGIFIWINCWITIICNIIAIITFTWYFPMWDYKFIKLYLELERKLKNGNTKIKIR